VKNVGITKDGGRVVSQTEIEFVYIKLNIFRTTKGIVRSTGMNYVEFLINKFYSNQLVIPFLQPWLFQHVSPGTCTIAFKRDQLSLLSRLAAFSPRAESLARFVSL
jgi:hypothetical protein